jgi:FkbM family methyltransferase
VAAPAAIVEARMRLGHRMLVDLRAPAQREAFRTGRYDDGLLGVALRLLAGPGASALDVGANVGFWTVPLAVRAATLGGRVHAFEPVPANRERLAANTRLNGVDGHVVVVPVALSDEDGTAAMTLREEFAAGAGTGNAAVVVDDGQDDRFETVEVRTARLDSLAGGLGVARLAVVKVDIEGHEDRFLAGAVATLDRWRPVVVSEWNRVFYDRRGVDPAARVATVLARLRYRVAGRDRQGRWRPADGFASERPVDDLVLAPCERLDEVLSLLDG